VALAPAPARGQSLLGNVTRVEADWKVVVTTPNPTLGSPQLATQMAPSANPDYFFQFHLNYTDSGGAGGMEIQAWDAANNLLVGKSGGSNSATLNTANETIKWTEVMDATAGGGKIKYSVKNGTSTTWGSFSFTLSPVSVTSKYTNLNSYDPFYTLAHSGPVFGAQAVTSMNPTAVRYTYSTGLVIPITLPPNCFNLTELTADYTR
jgi:hypothetical protein